MAGIVCVLDAVLNFGGRVMPNRTYTAFITFLGVAASLASNQAFGGSGAAPAGGSVSAPSIFRPSVTRRHHHIGRNIGTFFPWGGGFTVQPNVEVTQTIRDGIYTCTYDLPWDWVHRCPPSFFSGPPESPPPPVVHSTGCPVQTVTVPGADGKDQTVTMLRC